MKSGCAAVAVNMLLLASAGSALAQAQGAPQGASQADGGRSETVDDVVVYGRGERKIGIAVAASEGAVAGADLSVRPILRTAELIEAVPGMIATSIPAAARPTNTFCAASIWITARISA
ncbi:hypothetical protein [Brevundimonas nasdae]|uniref:hypothetical protein n=1 Tax=Brevundimonas nasdae TaxID=172043 RepID=UPI001FD3D38C|nr:hypothetical protein [Brevundimonas nasdae]